MAKTLGILASSNRHLDKIIGLCDAARKKRVEVTLFFTHKGTLLTQDPRFAELEGQRMFICRLGFENNGLKLPVSGMGEKDFTTQMAHAEMINDCDRYVVF